MIPDTRSRQRGAAFIYAIVFLAVRTVLSGLTIRIIRNTRQSVIRQDAQQRVLATLDAGLVETRTQLGRGDAPTFTALGTLGTAGWEVRFVAADPQTARLHVTARHERSGLVRSADVELRRTAPDAPWQVIAYCHRRP